MKTYTITPLTNNQIRLPYIRDAAILLTQFLFQLVCMGIRHYAGILKQL